MTTTLRKATINKDKPLEPKEEEVLVTLTDSFTRLKFNEKLPKELFQFTPPVGAKEEHERDE
jgi:outer membrane lipoprotein-sorting protein